MGGGSGGGVLARLQQGCRQGQGPDSLHSSVHVPPPHATVHTPAPRWQACHLSTWDPDDLASHEHVTTNKDPALRKVCYHTAGARGLLPGCIRLPHTAFWARRGFNGFDVCRHTALKLLCRAPPTLPRLTSWLRLPCPQALRPVLMSDPRIASRLCELSALFGYNDVPECARGGVLGSSDGDGGGDGEAVAAAGAAG